MARHNTQTRLQHYKVASLSSDGDGQRARYNTMLRDKVLIRDNILIVIMGDSDTHFSVASTGLVVHPVRR